MHLGYRCWGGSKAVSTMQQDDAVGFANKIQSPVKRGIAATTNHEVFIVKQVRLLDAIKKLLVFICLNTMLTMVEM